MTKDEALKLARTALGVQLDALFGKAGHLRNDDRKRYAENGIKAIDEALAQPEQEPMQTIPSFTQLQQIIMNLEHCLSRDSKQEFLRVWIRDWTEHKLSQNTTLPPVAEPHKRKPLTDEEVNKLVDDEDWYNDPHGFVRAIEAAHGIKENT